MSRSAIPPTLAAPLGLYSHLSRIRCSELLFIAGQVAADRQGALVGSEDLAEQARQVFANLSEALKSEALTFRNVVKFNTYLLGAANIVKFWTSVANFQRHTQSFRVDPEPGLRSRAWRGDRTWRPRYQP